MILIFEQEKKPLLVKITPKSGFFAADIYGAVATGLLRIFTMKDKRKSLETQ